MVDQCIGDSPFVPTEDALKLFCRDSALGESGRRTEMEQRVTLTRVGQWHTCG